MTREVLIDGYPFKQYRWSDGIYGYREPSYRAVRLFLIEKYGVCFFCAKAVKDYPHIDGVAPQRDLATIDHLKPRPHQKNPVGRKRFEAVEKVLACYQCNQARNVEYARAKLV